MASFILLEIIVMRLSSYLLICCFLPYIAPAQNEASSSSCYDVYGSNQIRIQSNGLMVSNAFLETQQGLPIAAGNKVAVGQIVRLILVIDNGWKVKDGRVFPGATEVIRLDDGYEVLRSEDLFTSYEQEGVEAKDAEFITLMAQITELKDKKRHAIVSFRIWDKSSTAQLSGFFSLYFNTTPAPKVPAKAGRTNK